MNTNYIILLIVLVIIYIIYKRNNNKENFDETEDFNSCAHIYGANHPRCKNKNNEFIKNINGTKQYIHPLTIKDEEELKGDYILIGTLNNQFINDELNNLQVYEMKKDNAYASYKLQFGEILFDIEDRLQMNDNDIVHFWKDNGVKGPFVFNKN